MLCMPRCTLYAVHAEVYAVCCVCRVEHYLTGILARSDDGMAWQVVHSMTGGSCAASRGASRQVGHDAFLGLLR